MHRETRSAYGGQVSFGINGHCSWLSGSTLPASPRLASSLNTKPKQFKDGGWYAQVRVVCYRECVSVLGLTATRHDFWKDSRHRARSATSADRRSHSCFEGDDLGVYAEHANRRGWPIHLYGHNRWRLQRERYTGRIRVLAANGHGGFQHLADIAFSAAIGSGQSIGHRFRDVGSDGHGFRDADHADQSRGHRANAGGGPLQQPTDDYGLRSRFVLHARPAAYSRRASGELANRRGADSEHEHREQSRTANRPEGHRLSGGAARKLRCEPGRPDVWRIQRGAAVWL